jgi:hypothetical protein
MLDSKPWIAREDDLEVYNIGKLRRSDPGVPKY